MDKNESNDSVLHTDSLRCFLCVGGEHSIHKVVNCHNRAEIRRKGYFCHIDHEATVKVVIFARVIFCASAIFVIFACF